MSAQVALVGAGPGDPGLVTRRGLELLRSCEVVIYDRLVAPEIVDEAPPEAERIYVGKQPGDRLMPQAAIDALMVEHARAGRRVVRLKGGDPFVFGRGADEAQALAAAGITFEVVPGVTSAVAVPAYAGIPVTYPGRSSAVTVMSAHAGAGEDGERWAAAARGGGTLVLLMGVGSLQPVLERLVALGRSPDEPAAIVSQGTTARQSTVVATLSTLAESARRAGIEPPATTVVGPVVELRAALDWFETRPLFGRTVVVTRPRDQAGDLAGWLRALGARVLIVPSIEIAPHTSSELPGVVERLRAGAFDWVVLSSANAAQSLLDLLVRAGADARALGGCRIAAVGDATARRLRALHLEPDLVPAEATGAGLAAALGDGPGTALVPRPLGLRSEAAAALAGRGWTVTELEAYETRPATGDPVSAGPVRAGDYDAIVFASPSAVRAFTERYGAPDGKQAVCIGPTTAEAARRAGIAQVSVAATPDAGGIAAALAGGTIGT